VKKATKPTIEGTESFMISVVEILDLELRKGFCLKRTPNSSEFILILEIKIEFNHY